jgi:hypothetical protein
LSLKIQRQRPQRQPRQQRQRQASREKIKAEPLGSGVSTFKESLNVDLPYPVMIPLFWLPAIVCRTVADPRQDPMRSTSPNVSEAFRRTLRGHVLRPAKPRRKKCMANLQAPSWTSRMATLPLSKFSCCGQATCTMQFPAKLSHSCRKYWPNSRRRLLGQHGKLVS